MATYVKRLVSLFLILILLFICNVTSFATGSIIDEHQVEDIDTGIRILTNINRLPKDTVLLAEETIPITISVTAEQFKKAGLKPPEDLGTKAAILIVNVKTAIGYNAADGLNFYVRADGPWNALLKSMSGNVTYKVSGWTRSTVPISVSVWIPQSAINWFYGTGRHPASGKSVSATFFVDVNALNEISGGSISRTVTAVIP